MHPIRPPWWMYVVAASFVGLLALFSYLVIRGPADPEGLEATFDRGTMLIRAVKSNTPFMKTGLQAGDRVLMVGGHPIQTMNDWAAVVANWPVGQKQIWKILRGESQVEIDLITERASWRNRLAHGYVPLSGLVLSCFALGLFIAFRRPGDLVARIGAWFIMTASVGFGLPTGWAVPWRQLPAAVQALLWIPELSRFVVEGIFLSFVAVFPCRLFRARWPWIVLWAPVLLTLPWRISGFYSAIYCPEQASPVPGWLSKVTLVRTMVYLAAAVVMLLIAYHRLADLNARRRVRVLMLGTGISLMTAIPIVWYFNFGYALNSWYLIFVVIIEPGVMACPLAFAYAILRHRVLDIQVIIRRSLQYAFARGAVLGVIPVLGAILIFDLAVNSEEPLVRILQTRGWLYAALGGIACLAYWQRKSWMKALDRRFFRERYNSERLLRDVVEEIREARSLERVTPRVLARIESALHPEFISLMVHEQGTPSYRSLASAPADVALPSLAADSKFVALARALGKPLETLPADSGWFDRRLPLEEIEAVRRTRLDLLVPISTTEGSSEALLALGIKRSEEPYSREDQELLEAIAASLGLLLGMAAPAVERPSPAFAACPLCGVCCDSGSGPCAHDGSILTPVPFPRTLAGRYRLERRRGRGGMGTVYEATDQSLERRVAVKVIREDWLRHSDAAQRFQREARAAASFSHPHVVTIYDYGVEAGTRAFLVMELLHGVVLRDELNCHKRLTAVRTVEILRGICSAIEAAHRRHLIHRDLKPENIFLAQNSDTGSTTVKVLDFGIAKFLPIMDEAACTQTNTETGAGILVGTLGYMSPEHLLGERPDVSWDLWALAVVAYETLTGALPFSTAARSQWPQSVLSGAFAPLSAHLPHPPLPWQEFFCRSLAADRTRRPSSAAEFFRDLEQSLLQLPEEIGGR